MTHGSLFSGIGGFDLAAEWMGWENKFHCEINKFCQKVLKKNFPESICYGDIKTTDFTIWRGEIDVISGGFPCQPFSLAGKQKGTADDRHLWPEMLRAIGEVQPGWVVGENVSGIINWSKGMVFREVQTDLENQGFKVFPPLILPACAVNADHRRDRVWFVAYSNVNNDFRKKFRSNGKEKNLQEINREKNSSSGEFSGTNIRHNEGVLKNEYASDTSSIRQQRGEQRMQEAQEKGFNKTSGIASKLQYSRFRNSLSSPRVFRGNDGLSNGVDRVKALGNAIVPQVVYEIFKTINQFECIEK